MVASYRIAIAGVLLSLALGACATSGTVSGDGNAGADGKRDGPIQTDDVRCEPASGSMPNDCQIIGGGQMTPSIRK